MKRIALPDAVVFYNADQRPSSRDGYRIIAQSFSRRPKNATRFGIQTDMRAYPNAQYFADINRGKHVVGDWLRDVLNPRLR